MNLPSSLTRTFDQRRINLVLHENEKDHTSGCVTPEVSDEIDRISICNRERIEPPHSSENRNLLDPSRLQRWRSKIALVLRRHMAFIGPGIVASVAYSDPGNYVTDLSAGSQFGYRLNFVILLSSIFGIFLQILAVRLGTVTGQDLAQATRLLCLPEDSTGQVRPDLRWRKSRIAMLWLNYFIAEGALIATELAELLGSAIALNLLFPKLPVWGGVLVTSADVLVILLVIRPNGNVRILELLIGALVLVVMACFIALLVKVKPHWPDVFDGFVPSKTLISPEALYAGIGILGAVIMPHSLYLGSHLATISRLPNLNESPSRVLAKTEAEPNNTWTARVKKVVAKIDPDLLDNGEAVNATQAPSSKLSISQIKLEVLHKSWDVGLSLACFATTINCAILIIAGAAFYYGRGSVSNVSDLYDAFNLLRDTLGNVYAVLFAIALLAAGQSASITVTIAGGLVSEGFIKWKTNLFVRRLVTRLITMVPSIAISIAVGRNGLEKTLVASQVALSFALPVVLIPLLVITSRKVAMTIEEDVDPEALDCSEVINQSISSPALPEATSPAQTPGTAQVPDQPFLHSIRTVSHDFSSPYYIIATGIVVYLAILLADFYTLVTSINPNL